MLYVQIGCPVCRTGVIGIRRCADGESLVLMCEECETVWASPNHIDADSALSVDPPDYVIPQLGLSVAGDRAGWATDEEVAAKGWGGAVKGMQPE
jgi:hypothetical protein